VVEPLSMTMASINGAVREFDAGESEVGNTLDLPARNPPHAR
jgi:hypothetical protein